MRFTLKDYQARATENVLRALRAATRDVESDSNSHWAVSLSAPTGAGKTVIASAVIEALFDGSGVFAEDPDATVLWVTDDPALNEQTKRKMLQAADNLGPSRLRTIDASFDSEKFEPQRVYFLNIQKLARTNKLARSNVEKRNYSLWQTIGNTIRDNGAHLYIVIDEAHRGMKDEGDRPTIVSRIINGQEGINRPAPIVWGITATPQRFTDAMARGTVDRTTRPIKVSIDEVRESGLLKDLIILDNPAQSQHEGDTTLVRAGVAQVREFETSWAKYAESQDEPPVLPVLVLQVQNSGTTDVNELSELLAAVFGAWDGLTDNNVVNTFADHTTLNIDQHVVRYMAPQDIQDDDDVRVVLCKDAISTGWDCPRAEVLVSLRRAEDYTYIAQLIGRMVRTPLARRVPTDQSLNTVNCYLPRFNKDQVQSIVDRFAAGNNDEPPVEAISDPVRVWRNAALDPVLFQLVEELPSYVVPGRAYRTQVARLQTLAALLAGDHIVENALDQSMAVLTGVLDTQRSILESDGSLQAAVNQIRSLRVERSYALLAAITLDDLPASASYEMELDDNNVDDLFRVSHRRLPEGLAKTYWGLILDRQDASEYDPNEGKAIVAALALRPEVVEAVEATAEQQVRSWLREHQSSITQLPDARRALYEPIRREARNSEPTRIMLPETRIEKNADHSWERHLLATEAGQFPAALKSWERRVLDHELEDTETVGWYRNPTGGDRALRVPYPGDDFDRAMYPDFIFFTRSTEGEIAASIVDPHGNYLSDALPKLRGLASYAEAHGSAFHRIESVIEDPDSKSLIAIDLKSEAVREAVRSLGDKSVLSLFQAVGGFYA